MNNQVEANLVRSLLGTYGIPTTVATDVPNLVYPNNVGEIRISVPEGTEEEALGILAAYRERLAPPRSSSLEDLIAFPPAAPLSAPDEAEEEDDDDEEKWDDDDDDVTIDGEDGGDDDEDEDEDDLFDDEE